MAARRIDIVGIILVMLIVAVVVVAILTLLGPPIGNVFSSCIAIMCYGTLDVEFEGFQPERYTVEVSIPTSLSPQVFNCPSTRVAVVASDPSGCRPNGLHLRDMTPDEVTIKVTWEGGTKTETFHPSYLPNGPSCSPACRAGTITMTLP